MGKGKNLSVKMGGKAQGAVAVLGALISIVLIVVVSIFVPPFRTALAMVAFAAAAALILYLLSNRG